MGTLKKKNRKILVGYIILNIILFSLLSNNFFIDTSSLVEMLSNPVNPSLISALLLFALSIVLEGFISSNMKAVTIFNRFKYPLPGCRIFSEIAKKDLRIDSQKLHLQYNDSLPEKPNEQNSEWYRLFQLYKYDAIIIESHKAFLLTRDLFAISILLFLISTVFHLIIGTSGVNIIYSICIYLLLIIIFKISAYNYGNRFAANVLVVHLNKINIG